MKIFAVRHGQTVENEAGIMTGHIPGVLSDAGKAQAMKVARTLKDRTFDHIYCSDLQRCIDTSQYIKEHHPDTPITLTHALRDYNLGIFQGKKMDEVDFRSLGSDPMNRRPEGGESRNDMRKRIIDFIKELLHDHGDRNVLAVTHSGPVIQLLSIFSGMDSEYIFHNVPIKNAGVFEIEVDKDMSGRVINPRIQ